MSGCMLLFCSDFALYATLFLILYNSFSFVAIAGIVGGQSGCDF